MLQLFTKLHYMTTQVTREEESGERGKWRERGEGSRYGGEEEKGGGIRVKLK